MENGWPAEGERRLGAKRPPLPSPLLQRRRGLGRGGLSTSLGPGYICVPVAVFGQPSSRAALSVATLGREAVLVFFKPTSGQESFLLF